MMKGNKRLKQYKEKLKRIRKGKFVKVRNFAERYGLRKRYTVNS